MSGAARRFPGIDAIKLAGIVTVVLIHALPPPWEPGASALTRWLHQLTRFGVPGFLFASGFLYAGAPADLATTRRRLRRILVPYAIASLLAELWHGLASEGSPGRSAWQDLLFGSAFGPYYYVFVIVPLVALVPGIARLPRGLLYAATAALVAAQWWVDAAAGWSLDFYWHLRNPLLWWAYFALGWVARLQRASLEAWLAPRRGAVALALAAAVALFGLASGPQGPLPPHLARSAGWLDVYAILGLIGAAAGRLASPHWLRALSDATYAVYLYHLFFVYAAQALLARAVAHGAPGTILVPWAAGLVGSLALVALGRRWLGPRARDWLGA